jgi:hypothetical protein
MTKASKAGTGTFAGLTRYRRPEGHVEVLGVSGPLGEVEWQPGGEVAYHSRAPRAGQERAACPVYPQGCYHTDEPAAGLALTWAASGHDDAVAYRELEDLYAEWASGSPPPAARPAVHPAPGGRVRARQRAAAHLPARQAR